METENSLERKIMESLPGHKYIPLCILLLIFSACSVNEVFNKFSGIRHAAWEKNDSIAFDIPVTDTISRYDVFVQVRNNNDYRFRNLWLFVQFKTPEGYLRKDTINCELADIYGKWHGHGTGLYTMEFPYEKNISFQTPGDYNYSFCPGMRENPLKGISDIGLRVVKHTEQ